MSRKTLPTALALAVAGFSAAPANAADEEQLDAVVVYGESYRSTGTKSELEPIESPMSFERYDAETLELQQANSLDDALKYVPGISTESRGSAVSVFDEYTIRGFNTYTNYYNGLPLQFKAAYYVNLAPQVDAFATDGIEILKGPASVLYGASSPGGMVNQLAKQPQSVQQTDVKLTTGSSNLLEAGVDSTGPVSDTMDYRLIVLSRQKDGLQEGTEEQRLVVAPSVTWYPTDTTSLNMNAYYQDDPKAIPSTPLPSIGTLTEGSFGILEPDTFVGDVNWAGIDKTVTMFGYKLNHEFSENLTFLQNFRYTDAELYQKNSYHQGVTGDTLSRRFYYTDETNKGFIVDNQFAYDFEQGDIAHSLLAGVEYHSVELTFDYGDTYSVPDHPLNLSNINNDQINPDALNFSIVAYEQTIKEEQVGVYVQDEITIDSLTVVAGLRYDQYDSVAAVPAWAIENKIDEGHLSSRLAAIYQLDNGWAPYATYSESFEPVAGTDVETGDALKPVTSNQLEAGVKFKNNTGVEMTAAAFQITKKNDIGYADIVWGGALTQTGETQSTGLELAVKADVSDKLDVMSNLTVMDVEITKDDVSGNAGNTPLWVAEKTANLWANYAVSEAVKVSGGVRYVGEMQQDNANTATVPAYTVFDLAGSYRVSDQYNVGLSVTNLMDEAYLSCYNDNCWYGSPRNIELTFNAKF